MDVLMFVAGLLSLGGAALAMNRLRPREGRPQPAWVRTDFGGNVAGLTMIVLALIGIGLVIKSVLG